MKENVKKGEAKKRLERHKGKHRRMNNKNGLFVGGKQGFQLKAKTGKPKKITKKTKK